MQFPEVKNKHLCSCSCEYEFFSFRKGSGGRNCGHSSYHCRDSYVVYDNDAEQSADRLLTYPARSIWHCPHLGVGHISHDEIRSSFLPVDMECIH